MAKTIGAFVFKDDGDGCLTAKWINNGEDTAYSEASKKLTGCDVSETKFVGKYTTTWIELNNVTKQAQLEIVQKHPAIFTLKWTKNNTTIFNGTAMLYGDLLIGSYWE